MSNTISGNVSKVFDFTAGPELTTLTGTEDIHIDDSGTTKNVEADIGIMPLIPNNFNHAKSDIKYIEYCAMSLPAIGSVFTNGLPSPYDDCELTVPDNCTVDDIDEVVEKLREPEFYINVKNELRIF